MIYFALSRHGYEQFASTSDPFAYLWVSGGVLSEPELADLRAKGVSVTNFSDSIDPNDQVALSEAIDTIKQHHPGQAVWVEHGYAA